MMKFKAFLLAVALTGIVSCGAAPAPEIAPRPVYVMKLDGVLAGAEGEAAYAGEVRAQQQAPLSFRVGGNLIERRVDVGASVHAGQVLAVLDGGDQSAQANAIRAQLVAAQAQLERARADQIRYAKLAQDQLISKSMMDGQNAAVAAAKGQVDAAAANLRLAANQSRYTQLIAPRNGVITERLAEAGQVVAPGQAVFSLAAQGAREVVFAVPETNIREIHSGMPVQIEMWADAGKRLNGSIREVSPMADPNTRTYTVRATIVPTADVRVDLGQSAKVWIEGISANGDASDITVPLAAVVRNDAQKTGVFVLDTDKATVRFREVKLGVYGQDRVPVLGGLKGDEWIVAAGGHLLREGQKVQAVDRDNRPVAAASAQ